MYVFLIQSMNIQERHKMITRLLLAFLLIQSTLAQHNQKPSQTWLTLNGERPVVIARGGFSGLFPASTDFAYRFALSTGLPGVILHCDLQLTKDGVGVCLSGATLDNSTNVQDVFPKGQKTYNVNGQDVRGWFALDFTAEELMSKLSVVQGVSSRSSLFDQSCMVVVEDVTASQKPPPSFWLNVQYSNFYVENKQNPALYVQNILEVTAINYISSPEIGFLKSLKVDKANTKLVFRFLEANAIEPTTNQSYGSLLKDLSSIKLFASGIMVPKEYIWPVDTQKYLKAPTTLVADAHKHGLKVYASGFANDLPGSYNYSYDPTAEYLQFIDNSQFSVDGFLTDFPPTASAAIACLANNKNASNPAKGKPLIITHNGASGVYPGCTDLAYQQAVEDGADIIDCTVQMSKDGVAFCLESPDLSAVTTAKTVFMSKSNIVPEIQKNPGIYSFDLTWSEIQTLKPQLKNAFIKEELERNPANKNKGKFMTLTEFLEFSKKKKVNGILIAIENAAFLASKKGLNVTGTVANALSNASFDNQSTQKVLIQSDDSSVLYAFRIVPIYIRVLSIKETISDVPDQTLEEIKKFASAVDLRKASIIPTSNFFTVNSTGIVQKLHKANISVYVSPFRNEFVTLAFDYFSDPMVELATYAEEGVDGFITDYPATASAYLRSPCSEANTKLEYTILPSQPGSLLNLAPPEDLQPAEAPAPALDISDVVDPPLPPVISLSEGSAASVTAPAPASQKAGQTANIANIGLCLVAIAVISLLSMGY